MPDFNVVIDINARVQGDLVDWLPTSTVTALIAANSYMDAEGLIKMAIIAAEDVLAKGLRSG